MMTEKKKRRLMMLEDVRIASPCPASWDEMLGNDRTRFCTGCEKNVYDISNMTRDEAEELISANEGDLCVRFFQRADGTIMTSDCSVGAKRKLRKKAALSIAAAGAMALAAIGVEMTPRNTKLAQTGDVTDVDRPSLDIHPIKTLESRAADPAAPPVPPPVVPNIKDVWADQLEGHMMMGGIGFHREPEPENLPKKPLAKR